MLSFNKGASFAVFFLFLLISALFGTYAATGDKQSSSLSTANIRRILFLNSYHLGYLWSDQIVYAAKKKISGTFPNHEFYVEFMDSKRVYNETTNKLLKQTLTLKYKKIKLDVIIVSDDNALDFMLKYHDELFPGVPVVFCGINDPQRALSVPRKVYTGLVETTDEKPNIELILNVWPKVKKIYLISDATPTGLSMRRLSEKAMESFPQLKLVILKGEELSTDELLERLRKVEPYNAVLMNVWFRDKTAKYFSLTDVVPLFTENCKAPIFGVSDFLLGYGVVGGQMNSGKTQGRYAGDIAIRIMRGTPPEDIPIIVDSVNDYLFSWSPLKRFSIDEKKLPAKSIIVNKPFSFYQTYKKLVWSVIGVFIAFTILVIALAINGLRLQKAKFQLSRSEKNLETILNSIGDAVIAANLENKIVRMNPVAEAISGWPQSEALFHDFSEVFPLTSLEDHNNLAFSIKMMPDDETNFNINRHLLHSKDGSEKLISMGGSPIRNEQNETIGQVIVLRDVTDEAALQERLHQSERLQSVGMLAGGIAHDFNNMLVGIFGAAEVLSLRIKAKREKKLVDIILSSAKRASLLTSKLLVFSRKGNTEFAPADINSVVKNVLSLLEHTIDKQIALSMTLEATAAVIECDEPQLQNALINIGINASHAMPDGGKLDFFTTNVTLDDTYCSASSFDVTPGKYVKVEIRDTGTGIPPEHINRIFEPFFTTKEQGKGTGLGLAAVYGTIQSHHGAVTVYSEVGSGTSFHLYFPLSDKNALENILDEEPIFEGEGTILVVDDEEMVRSVAISILEDVGYKILSASNGEEAIKIYKEKSGEIDMIILDMIMPKLNGVDTFEQLKKLDPDVKVLIASGFSKEDDFERMKENGARGFLRKPYLRAELCRKIAEIMS